jgi:hypothetical protein
VILWRFVSVWGCNTVNSTAKPATRKPRIVPENEIPAFAQEANTSGKFKANSFPEWQAK